MKRYSPALWLLLGLLLSLAQVRLHFPATPGQARPPWVRLMGPASELGRSIQWIRFRRAVLRGDLPRALVLGESAVALDPRATDGWQLLVSHLGYLRASPEREQQLANRRKWLQAAVELTRRGAEQARHPEELHLQRGLMLLSKIELDPMIDPGGPQALMERSLQAFREAAQLGSAEARDLLLSLAPGP